MDVHLADVALSGHRRVRRRDLPAADGGEGPALLGVHVRGRGADPLLRPAPAAAGAAQPAVQRGEVHLVRRGADGDPRRHRAGALRLAVADQRRPGDRVLRHRHRDRHPGRAAQGDLRGVPAGRRHDQPEVRRHRPRPVDQPRHRRAHRRRDPRGERARPGQHVHALRPPASRSPSPRPRRRPTALEIAAGVGVARQTSEPTRSTGAAGCCWSRSPTTTCATRSIELGQASGLPDPRQRPAGDHRDDRPAAPPGRDPGRDGPAGRQRGVAAARAEARPRAAPHPDGRRR